MLNAMMNGALSSTPLTLGAGPLSYEQITVFLLAFGVLLGAARLLGEVARRLGQPVVLGEILAGILLGATFMGNGAILGEDSVSVRFHQWLFPMYVVDEHKQPVEVERVEPKSAQSTPMAPLVEGNPTPGTATLTDPADAAQGEDLPASASTGRAADATREYEDSKLTDSAPLPVDHGKTYDAVFLSMSMFLNLSVVFLLLVAGLEVDLSVVWKQGKSALGVSLMGIVIPFSLGVGLALLMPNVLGYDEHSHKMLPFVLFIGIAMSITALPIIAKTLMDLNLFKSDLGMLIMSSAMVDDILGWLGFAVVLAMTAGAGADAATSSSAAAEVGMTVALTFLFVGFMLTVGRWLMHKALPFIQANTAWPGGVLGFVLTVTLFCAAATEAIGIHAIFGAFIAGIAIGDSRHLRQQTRQTIEQFINNIFAPVFFASIGLRVNFIEGFDILTVSIVLVVAVVGKVMGCYAGAKWSGLSRRESAAIGFGMSARGAMEIILGQIALANGLITEKLFVALVFMALTTSLIAGPAMQLILRQKTKRRLPDIITDKLFVHRLKGRTAHAAIEELSSAAAVATGLDAAKIADAVWKREQILSTGLPNALAVPHARLAEIDKPCVVIGMSEPGIDFDAQDGKPAEVIALLLTPLEDGEAQLELLAMVAEAFETPEAHASAMSAANFTEFKAALMVANARPH